MYIIWIWYVYVCLITRPKWMTMVNSWRPFSKVIRFNCLPTVTGLLGQPPKSWTSSELLVLGAPKPTVDMDRP